MVVPPPSAPTSSSSYESLKTMRGQIVVDFIVEHRIIDEHNLKVGYVTYTPWKLFFDGSACDDRQGIGAILISPNDTIFEFSKSIGGRAHAKPS